VWIVVLNYNGAQITLNCVDSLLKIEYPNFGVIVVDNASTDDSARVLGEAIHDPRVELMVNDRNYGYAGGNNRGIEKAMGYSAEYVLILNNDTLLFPDTLSRLVAAMEQLPRVGVITGRCYTSPGKRQPGVCAYLRFPTPARAGLLRLLGVTGLTAVLGPEKVLVWLGGHHRAFEQSRSVSWVSGALMLARREAIQSVGPLDDSFFLTYEDTDWCFRMQKAGWGVYYSGEAEYIHFVSSTRRRARGMRQIELWSSKHFFRKHYGVPAALFYGVLDRILLSPLEAGRRLFRPLRQLPNRRG
jgi:hypothetical protein